MSARTTALRRRGRRASAARRARRPRAGRRRPRRRRSGMGRCAPRAAATSCPSRYPELAITQIPSPPPHRWRVAARPRARQPAPRGRSSRQKRTASGLRREGELDLGRTRVRPAKGVQRARRPAERRVACAGSQATTRLPSAAKHRAPAGAPGRRPDRPPSGDERPRTSWSTSARTRKLAELDTSRRRRGCPPAEDPVVARVEGRELDLALGAFASASVRGPSSATAHSRSVAGATASALSTSM